MAALQKGDDKEDGQPKDTATQSRPPAAPRARDP
jgi:hypothetical protein